MNLILIIALVSTLASSTQSLSLMQTCPTVNAVANFNTQRYTGKWFEIYRGPLIYSLYEAFVRCVQAEYYIIDSRNIQVKNGGYVIGTNYFYNRTGNAYIVDPSQPGKLAVSFSSTLNTASGSGNSSNYIVVDTDYTNYSLVYSCSIRFYGLIKNEQAYILSRARTLNQTIVDNLFVKIKAISPGIIDSVKKSDQTKCPA